MKPSLSLFVSMQLVFLLSLFYFTVANFSSSTFPLCHGDERSALLQFKESFVINKSASDDPYAYPKVASWKPDGGSGDCCSWDGIECDEDTGHVISLDLTSSCLYGSINSSSSLFLLVHLEWLSLADNDFNYSEIPSGFGNLSRLSDLDLSFSVFSGQIPPEILELSKLVSLDLGHNSLKLQKPGLRSLVEKLTNLRKLRLSRVNISSTIPHILANMSSLTSLLLKECELHGEFPTGIFQLSNLQFLSVRFNPNLTGYLPEFPRGSSLEDLRIAGTSFSGKLPDSIGNLNKLSYLDLSSNNFSGQIPSSWANLTQLTELCLSNINLTGQIPFWLGNLTQLTAMELDDNKLHGPIPQSIFSLLNIKTLYLEGNYLSGKFDFDLFSKLKNLIRLQLSGNNLSVITKHSINVTLPKFKVLGLVSCDLNEFPDFLQNQDKLTFLDISYNNIHGQIPKWLLNSGKKTLGFFSLTSNFITGFDQPPVVLPWTKLGFLDLSYNILQGSIPIPPSSILFYSVSNNRLAGEISPCFCNLTSVVILDLSNNRLGGVPPQCLGNLSNSLSVLSLQNNKFHGNIPQTYIEGCKLRMIDFSQNQLRGKVPRSLANCSRLETLNIGNNQINDTFPSWLGTLAELKVLILHSNEFHGAIEEPETKFEFPMLHIIDISNNSFTGKLPSQHFQMWNAMRNLDVDSLRYLKENTSFDQPNFYWSGYFVSMTITNKGTEIYYEKIQELLVAIDLSSNRFEGEIPEVIGDLKALRLLNLSNNILTGHLPLSLRNLSVLEALDLSQNKLSGEIPPELLQLTFLASLNLSHNRLTGLIPLGNQFNTFQYNSFEGNPGLCGNPLSKKCAEVLPLPPSSLAEDESSDSLFEFDWKIVLMGYGSGLVIGIVIGHTVINRKHEWFVKTFGTRQLNRNYRRRGQKN